ncbi:FAD-dependent oxidoreductase [Saccharopolyspora sp. SCSIO 74807]|uniref:NAD(P)/FAD-dependent oxidoreductase n=1 Tax=Saccharopolyspora sp. SCSIO 74807 TaxID=3118084 RepID=UPI0030CB1D59
MPDEHATVVVIGGGPAGASAARGYRAAGGTGRVVVLSADTAAPYFRPALSKEFLREEFDESDLPIEQQEFYDRCDVELCLDEPVEALRPGEHVVRTRSGRTFGYQRCILATGARPSSPLPGADRESVRTLRSLDSARTLRAMTERASKVAVVGAGFIGCEAAVSLARRGKTVTLTAPDVLPQQRRLGAVAGGRILGWLHEENIRTELSAKVDQIADGPELQLADGRTIDSEIVLLATGIRPRVELAADAGLATAEGRVLTDARMRSTAPDVYAAGDVALAHNATAGRPLLVEHWGEALTMGDLAARNAAGDDRVWDNPPGFWTDLGGRALKYAAWGDGYDDARVHEHSDGAFTIWYASSGSCVGVLTYGADEDYERGIELISQGAALPSEAALQK